MSDSDKDCNISMGCLFPIVLVSIIIFFFWGEPDNWDKLNTIIDAKYNQIE